MADDLNLSKFEEHVMLAILRLRPHAYGVPVRQVIKERTGKDYSFGSIYAVLERLEERGFLTSDDPKEKNGSGRSLQYFTITGSGSRALAHNLSATERMRDGIDWGGLTA